MAPVHPRSVFGASTSGVTNLWKVTKSLGILEIDIAGLSPFTHGGDSERLFGEGDAGSKGFAIDTKILVLSRDANGTLELGKLEGSLFKSRKSLKLQKLNILHCHAPDYTTPLKDQAATMDKSYQEGLFTKVC